MRNIKLTVEYDGGRYGGWQRLGKDESENTIENKLLEIIKKMTGVDGEINCGCRTEVGVHAYSQIINFKTATELKLTEIKRYFNRYLPMDIAVIDIEEVAERFHASLNAKSKTYVYRIAIGEVPSVFDRKFTYYCFQTPDVKTMRSAARHFVGKHDFKKFSSVKKGKSTEKEIYSIDIREEDREIKIVIKADDFLHNMARIVIGTILEIGLGKRKVEDIDAIFLPTSKEIASVACSAQGLFLKEIEY